MIKLSEIAENYNEQTPVLFLQAWIINLAMYTGLQVEKWQTKDIAIGLYREIRMFNLAELTLFFDFIKRGRYGEFYGRFDGIKIISAARDYRKRRGEVLCKLSEQQQLKLI